MSGHQVLLLFDQLPDTSQKGADLTQMGLAGRPISASARMRYFRQEANRRKHQFSCDHVWTFSLYQVCTVDNCKHCPAWGLLRSVPVSSEVKCQ